MPTGSRASHARRTQMSDALWCPDCHTWCEYTHSFFFTPRCEECGSELEEKDLFLGPVEADHKEVDISHKFTDEDDTEDDTEDAQDDTEDVEAASEAEAE